MKQMYIICDFDGTTAVNDVGNLLFRTFADKRCYEIVDRWKAGEINSKECLLAECEISTASKEQLLAFSDTQKLDADFAAFVEYCKKLNIPVSIASDGLDFYINRIVAKHGLINEVPVFANSLKFTGNETFTAEFPFWGHSCGECGNCKGYHVRKAQESGFSPVVYIGDGLSDRCGAKAADIVFAKRDRDLIRYCQKYEIDFHEYENFSDILSFFKNKLIH